MNESSRTLYVGSVEKAFEVLQLFDINVLNLSLSEIVEQTSLNKSAAQRYVHTLEKLGYLFKNPDTKRYQLTIKNLFPASGYLNSNELIRIAAPHLVQLRLQLNARIGLSVLWEGRVVYLIALQSSKEASQYDYPGFNVPVYCTTSGRMFLTNNDVEENRDYLSKMERIERTHTTKTDVDEILACIATAKKQGFCTTDQEYRVGHLNMCVPVVHGINSIKACIVCVVRNSEWSMQELEKSALPKLQEASRLISGGIKGKM